MSIHVARSITQQAVEALLPYARNSRTHSEEQLSQLAASIREFGFTNPVLVDGAGGIIAGHGRVMAAKLAGLLEVPTVDVGWMTEAQRRAYVIADNQLALNAGWDEALLTAELGELSTAGFDLALIGFDAGELEKLLGFDDGAGEDEEEKTDPGINYVEKFAIVVDCAGEADQQAAFDRLTALGYKCKVLVN